jgi:hypothetical protein
MNTAKLARSTFVLDRETHSQLRRISVRMGVSRSELVRDVLTEPVAMMAKWVDALPDDSSPADGDLLRDVMQGDMIEFLNENVPDLVGLRVSKT